MTKDQAFEPIWMRDRLGEDYPALREDLTVDVCVVGAGMAGLSVAHCLAREGRRVAVLDSGGVGCGQTRRTSAHLSNAIDRRYAEIARTRGRTEAHLAAQSHTAAIDHISAVVDDEGIDCDFTRVAGYLFGATAGDSAVEEEYEAAVAAGVPGVELLQRPPLPGLTGPCVRFPQQAQFHPLRYLTGLAAAVVRRGGLICGDSHVESVDGKSHLVTTRHGPAVHAGSIVIATNTPVFDRVALHTKQAPYLTYVIAVEIDSGQIPAGLYWDTADPFHYARIVPGTPPLLLVGGEDHKSGQADDGHERFARLERWTRDRFPGAGGVAARWSGQVMETIDGLAFIGRNPFDSANVFVATGDSGVGLTHATIAGLLLTDLILGRGNPWESIYDPSRAPLATAPTFLRENLNVAAQFADWLTEGDADDVDAIAPGHGAIVRRGLRKLAVYRDEGGDLHVLSAVCPHLGCMVAWNDTERGWDCPCHGSRFDCFGRVTNGPANSDLRRIDSPSDATGEVVDPSAAAEAQSFSR